MKTQRLITINEHGNSIGLLCGTPLCLTTYTPNGCQNCPMFKAINEKLKFFEDAVEEINDEELCNKANNNSISNTASQ